MASYAKYDTTRTMVSSLWWTPELTIEDMHRIAAERGGKCLSTVYDNTKTKIEWECAKGHQWHATPSMIRQGQWCRQCSIKKRADSTRLGIAEMHRIAAERGGKCLSTVYVNANTKLEWECAEGHQWHATPSHIKSGQWCRQCSRRKRRRRA